METEVHSGLFFSLDNPSSEDVLLDDIAHHLGMQCRFNGGVDHFHSVAEHSVTVSQILLDKGHPLEICLGGLLHDGHETYIGDLATPFKLMLGSRYKKITHNLDVAICDRFTIPLEVMQGEIIHEADLLAMAIEAHWLVCSGGQGPHWSRLPEPLLDELYRYRPICLSQKKAKEHFMAQYNRLIHRLLQEPGNQHRVGSYAR